MTGTLRKLDSNRTNAAKSTGPRSATGKAVASRNAERHGILSSRLLIDGEDGQAFEQLVDELASALRPVGAIETALLERIAVTIWRQRRLVEAESAATTLGRSNHRVAQIVARELPSVAGGALDETSMVPIDPDHEKWCRDVFDECTYRNELDIAGLETAVPLTFTQLVDDAEDTPIATYLDDFAGGLVGYMSELSRWCEEQIANAERRPRVLEIAEKIRAKRLVLSPDALDLFARYQTTLDNQLVKMLKALREAQDWRLTTLEAVVDVEIEVNADATDRQR